MSEPAASSRPFYVTGGTLKPGEPSYVERRADTELFESLLAGEFCYVLTARQMGKSSLMARTAKRLEQAGVASAIVDLTQIGSERGDQAAAQWYFGIANLIHRQLGIATPLRPWWQERADLSSVQRLTDFFRELVLPHVPGRIVIFVDEIDSTIGLPFADDFFAALRACFNARATDPAFERLTFVLLGVATPDQLIQDPARTPFNIGKRIDLTDFSLDEARSLASGLHADLGEAGRRLERVLHWTGGHPYLTQALCRAVRERGEAGTAEESVDPQVEELFLTSRAQREETNIKHARARLEKRGPEGRRLLQLYRRVRQGKPVPDQPTSPLFAQLKLAGVVKATDEGRLAVRNRIYEEVFTPEWAKSAMPADRGRQLAVGTLAASLISVLIWYAAFQPRPYEAAFQAAFKDDGYSTALEAYTALRRNPFARSKATELMQQFWEQRALRYALANKRDESLLSYLQGLTLRDSERLGRQARNLVGADFEGLRFTLRHQADIMAVAFSPDNGTILTGSSDSTVRLWDTRTGKPLAVLLGHQDSVMAVAFSPDGGTVLTGSLDKTARLWSARTGQSLTAPLQHQDSVLAVAFSPDGGTVLTGSLDKTARLWSARTGQSLTAPLQHQDSVLAVTFSPDGGTVLTGDLGTARLWSARTGQPLTASLQHQGSVSAVAFSPDGGTVLTGSLDNTARLWSARTGQPLTAPLQHQDSVLAVAFSPDGGTVLTGSLDKTARFWSARTGQLLTAPLQHQDSVLAVAFSPDGGTVLTGSSDKTTRLWSARTGQPPIAPLQHQDGVFAVAFSPDGGTVLTGASDTARLRSARTGQPLTAPLQHQDAVFAVAFSPDGGTVLTGSLDKTARLWSAHTGQPLTAPLRHQGSVWAVAFSPDGGTVLTGSSDKTARLWSARTGQPLIAPLQHYGTVWAVALSPDGGTVLTGALDTARLWSARTGQPLTAPLRHQGSVWAVAFSPDGRTVLTGSSDRTVRLWSARTGQPLIAPLQHQDVVRAVTFSPDGKVFVVATDYWLNTYSWDGKNVVPQSSQLLQGFWKDGFRFPANCKNCLQVALGDTGNSFHIEALRLDAPTDPPIEGDPKKLLGKWQARLGLKFDEQMRPVPRWQ